MSLAGKNCSIPKKLAIFHDLSGFGRCSLTVAIPVASALGIQTCPVPTEILSNHTAYPSEYRFDFTQHMPQYLKAWEELGLSFDGILTGYMNKEQQVKCAADFIDRFRKDDTVVFVDPAMADGGRLYRGFTPEYIDFLKTHLICRATIIKPNLTEACFLSCFDYKSVLEAAGEESPRRLKADLINIMQFLKELGPEKIVITGIERGGKIINAICEGQEVKFLPSPRTGRNRPGTGDIFSAITCASVMKGMTLEKAVKKAADFTATAILVSEEAGVPVEEGVLFETILSKLSATADFFVQNNSGELQ